MIPSGIDILGDVNWGTHFCQFYETGQDLKEIIVPYLRAGLLDNEFCMWVTSAPLQVDEATAALRVVVPDLDNRIACGQIEILDYSQWYTKSGRFCADEVLQGWVDKLETAQRRGYAGLRLTGNTFWLEPGMWSEFTAYEEAINHVIGKYPMVAMCTYCVSKCSASEIIDVVANHEFTLIKRQERWEIIESAHHKATEAALRESEARYRRLFEELTEGFALHELVLDDKGVPCDYRFLEVNPAFERLTGLKRKEVVGNTVYNLLPGNDPVWLETFARVVLTGDSARLQHHSTPLNRDYEVFAYSPAHGQFAVLFRDITEQNRMQEALRRSERHHRLLFETMLQGVVYQDADGRITSMNPAAERILGKTREEFVGQTSETVQHHTLREDGSPFPGIEHPAMVALYTGQEQRDVVMGVYNPREKAYRWISINAVPICRSGESEPYQVYTIFDDITERRRVEHALRDSEERYRSLVELAPDAVVVHRDTVILYANAAALRLFGADSLERLCGRNILDYIHPDDREMVRGRVRSVQSGERTPLREIRIVRRGRQEIPVEAAGAPASYEGGLAVQVILRDISERKRAEQQLEEAKRLLDALMEHVPEGISIVDSPALRVSMVSRYGWRTLGIPANGPMAEGNLLKWPVYEPDGVTPLAEARRPLLRALGGETVINQELATVGIDGNCVALLCNAAPIRNSSGDIVGGITVWRDISELKRAEEALRQSEERFRLASEVASEAIYEWNLVDGSTRWSSAYETMFGPSFAQGDSLQWWSDHLHPSDRDEVLAGYHEALKGAGNQWTAEYRFLKADGTWADIYDRASIVRDGSGRAVRVVGAMLDVTHRKRAQQELEQRVAERTAELRHANRILEEQTIQLRALAGRLAVAEERERQRLAQMLHDHLQQLLVGARVHLSVATDDAKTARKSLKRVDELLEEAFDAARNLTYELSPPALRDPDLGQVLKWLAQWSRDTHGIAVSLRMAAAGVQIRDEGLRNILFGAVRELLLNAVKYADVKRVQISSSHARDGRLKIVVSDKGAGFDADRLHLNAGIECGLGLFSIRERLESVGGHLAIESAPGKGSRFTILVPVESAGAAAEPVPGTAPAASTVARAHVVPDDKQPKPSSRIRVLLADDHEVVRDGLASVLAEQPDIEVVGQAANGLEAVELARQWQPDVILMDINMPKMSGTEATKVVVRELPEVRVIALSVFDDAGHKNAMLKAGATAVLNKRIASVEVVRAIRKCMRAQKGGGRRKGGDVKK